MRCDTCSAPLQTSGGPKAINAWCSPECRDAWWAAHPEEAAGWVRIEDVAPEQRAEAEALLGLGAKC